jgi:hypothetical protein
VGGARDRERIVMLEGTQGWPASDSEGVRMVGLERRALDVINYL